MTADNAKKMMDAFYLGKRIFDRQPELPKGVSSSYIHVLDAIVRLQKENGFVRVSDISETLRISRPGITRTVKSMEAMGYLEKQQDTADGRVMRIRLTENGHELYRQYVDEYFAVITDMLKDISDSEIEAMYETVCRINSRCSGMK